MSNNGSNKISKIGEIVRSHGKEGLKTLILFKLIKEELRETIEKEHDMEANIDEDELNELCMTKARELLTKGKENPSKEDIKQLLSQVFSDNI